MFHSPFTSIISGATGTGKSQWIIKLIKNANEMIDPPPQHILYCYSEINNDIINLKKNGVEVFNGVPTKELIMSKPKNLLLILDDLTNDINSDFLSILFTKGSHHWNVSVMLVCQNLFDKNVKIARINSHIIILMKSPQSLLQIRTLGSQLFPGRVPYFLEAYNDAVQQREFGYLVINMSPNMSEELRLSTKIFPNDKILIYLPI
jgi:hypothetical protein